MDTPVAGPRGGCPFCEHVEEVAEAAPGDVLRDDTYMRLRKEEEGRRKKDEGGGRRGKKGEEGGGRRGRRKRFSIVIEDGEPINNGKPIYKPHLPQLFRPGIVIEDGEPLK